MSRPIIKIALKRKDYILEAVALIAIIGLITIPFIYYQQLPDIIPNHFNAKGKPDSYGSKAVIWLYPTIGLLLYLGLTAVSRIPHRFNYPVKITEENAYYQYKNAVKLTRTIKLFCALIFLYLTHKTVTTALGDEAGLGAYFLPLFLGLIFTTLAVYVVNAVRNKRIDDHLLR